MDEKKWGGARDKAGRITVIPRYTVRLRMAADEKELTHRFIDAFKNKETEILKKTSKKLKCPQYEIAQSVHDEIIAIRKKITETAISEFEKEAEQIISKIELKEE